MSAADPSAQTGAFVCGAPVAWVRSRDMGMSSSTGTDRKMSALVRPCAVMNDCISGERTQMPIPMPDATKPDEMCTLAGGSLGLIQLMIMPKDAAAVPEGSNIPSENVSIHAERDTGIRASPESIIRLPAHRTKRLDVRRARRPKTGCIKPKNSWPRPMMKLTVAWERPLQPTIYGSMMP